MAKSGKPSTGEGKYLNLGRLSDAQDSALDAVAAKVSKKRGTRVTRSDITREALAMYCRAEDVEWPC